MYNHLPWCMNSAQRGSFDLEFLSIFNGELPPTWLVLEYLGFWIDFKKLLYPSDMIVVPVSYKYLGRECTLLFKNFLYCFDPGCTAFASVNQNPLRTCSDNIGICTFND